MACLFGLMVCVIITLMCLTKSINLNCFYDVGEIYDVGKTDLTFVGNNWVFDSRTGCISILEDISNHIFAVTVQQKNWNYLYLELDELEEESDWDIQFLNADYEATGVISQPVKNGLNILELPKEEIYAINIVITNQKGLTFSIPKMQFRERQQTFGWKEFWMVFAVVSVLYLIIIQLYRRFWKRKKTEQPKGLWIEEVQKIYSSILNQGACLRQKVSCKAIVRIRTFLFFVCYMILYLMVTLRWRWRPVTQNKMVLLLGICLLLIAVLSWEKKNAPVCWKNPLVYAWFIQWVLCIISDFLVKKSFNHTGIFMLAAAGPFFLSWNRMEKPEELLRDLKKALEIFYWLACIFCIVCRPYTAGNRYMGIFNNPNTFAGFLVTVNLVFLDYAETGMGEKNLKYRRMMRDGAGIVSVCFFLLLTQSITGTTVYMLEWLVFLWQVLKNRKEKSNRKIIILNLGFLILNVVLMVTLGKWCLMKVAGLLNTAVSFPGDLYLLSDNTFLSIYVYASDEKLPLLERISQKFSGNGINFFLSGRDEVWKVYLRQLNLFGHGEWPEVGAMGKMHAHNNLLQMMYDYGVFIALPYLTMVYYSLKYSLKNFFQNREMSLFILGVILNFHMIGLTEDVTSPYSFASWLTFYLVIGSLFVQQAENVRR